MLHDELISPVTTDLEMVLPLVRSDVVAGVEVANLEVDVGVLTLAQNQVALHPFRHDLVVPVVGTRQLLLTEGHGETLTLTVRR